ncbi:MAG: hypothetical protein RBR72_07225, partial [Prevotella sp.]|nr:hypothetical protein [Prevotella sp.]
MEANDNIELRSERVRKIIGKVPPRLISLGITIVTFFIAGMIWVVTTVHFPFTIECSGGIHYFEISPNTYYYANIEVPYKYLYMFHEHRRFNISFEGFRENEIVVATTDGY